MTATATQGGWTQQAIPMVNKAGKKIKLHLRRMSFEREIADLPADIKKLHKMMTDIRGSQNENVYMAVAAWKKLRCYDRFWTSFGFALEIEYLSYYDLPDGATLAGWSFMVEHFDKDTFVLLGDEVLRFMMRSVSEYHDTAEKKKHDYQAIFDTYCGMYDGFDKQAFYSVIRRYVEDTYVKPELDKQNITREEWVRRKAAQRRDKTVYTRKRFKAPQGKTTLDGDQPKDFQFKTRTCPVCIRNAEIMEAARTYIANLENVIRQRLGEKAVPHRPKLLIDLS